MLYILYFILAALFALLITPLVRSLAIKIRTLDVPALERKIHKQPLPLLGGLAVFLAFILGLIKTPATGNPFPIPLAMV